MPDPRVFVRRGGEPAPEGRSVVYWMQRSQRAVDNAALDVAIRAGNALKLTVVTFFAPVPFYPHANLRHYQFLFEGVPDIAAGLFLGQLSATLAPRLRAAWPEATPADR